MTAPFLDIIPELAGVKPSAYLVLGPGWVREEWKSMCFSQGEAITQAAVQNLNSFAAAFVSESSGRMLDRSARVELLRQSFKDANLKDALPTLFMHRYRPKFYESLDRALQRGRMFFAHAEEGRVLEARLRDRLGEEPRREEYFLLNRFWESLLQARDFYDEARVFEIAVDRLQTNEAKLPVKRIYRAKHFIDPPRVEFFWQALSERYEVQTLNSESLKLKADAIPLKRKIAHSMEDAVQFLLDEIVSSKSFDAHAVVIEDRPEIRRSVKRAAEQHGLPLLDARDPTLLLNAEEMKTALLPLEIVARNFPSQLVLPWLATQFDTTGKQRFKIIESGSPTGIENYRQVPDVYERLKLLQARFPARMNLQDLQVGLEASFVEAKLPSWVKETFARVISTWSHSLEQLGRANSKKPARLLLDELKEKLKTATPILGPERNRAGLRLYRVDQAVSLDLAALSEKHIHFFGLTSDFFDPRDSSTEWFSVRDTEVLSSEFGIPGKQVLTERAKQAFLAWASQDSESATLWDFLYDEAGSERDSLELSLKIITEIEVREEEKLPVHPKVLPSFSTQLRIPTPFANVAVASTQFPMSFLNAMGNCGFTAFGQHLLKLFDERDPDFDLSGDAFGNLVHAAVEALVSSKLTMTPLQAFEDAWYKTAKPAWIRSDRLFKSIRSKTLSILENFIVSEHAYLDQSKSELIGQEISIDLKRDGLTFHGRMDRIDQHADGIVLFDYKTSSVLPSGSVTREKGKGLQLPAYALALKDERNQEVVGAQYVQLLPRKTQRNSGFLFARWNKGKKADVVEFPLSTARSISGSLIQAEPEEVWQELDQRIVKLIHQIKQGNFEPKPADPKDCERCRYQLVCGVLRKPAAVVEPDDT